MKNVYLIMAHNEPKILSILVKKLKQDERNDVLVHIDKKVKGTAFQELESAVQNGGGKICPVRICVTWGDSSQIKAEMALFEEAAKGKYDYYHLLSGSDLPIKPVREIGDFFDLHPDKVFLDCVPEMPAHLKRIKFCTDYWHFMKFCSTPIIGKVYLKIIDKILVSGQKMLGMSRCAKMASRCTKATIGLAYVMML